MEATEREKCFHVTLSIDSISFTSFVFIVNSTTQSVNLMLHPGCIEEIKTDGYVSGRF